MAIVQPPVNEKNEHVDSIWFDIKRLDITGQRVMPVPQFAEIELGMEKGPADKPREMR